MTQDNENSQWSQRDIFWLGYFGPNTPAAVRYRNRSLSALVALVVVAIAAVSLLGRAPWIRWIAAAAPGLTFGFIALEWWRYINSLDELARRLQMEAMAWTYIVGVFAMMALGGLGLLGWNVNVMVFILLELVRAHRLSTLAKRH